MQLSAINYAGEVDTTQRERRKYAAAVAFVVVFAIGQYVVQPATTAVVWWADIAWTLASMFAALECLRTARLLGDAQRRAWLFFAAGCGSWFIAMLIWDYQELIRGELTPFPSVSQPFYSSIYPLFVIGFMHLSERRGMSLTLKDTADLGMIVSVFAFGSWMMFSEHLDNPAHSFVYKSFATGIPVLSLSALVFALLALLRHAPNPGRMVLLLFFTSLGLLATTDSLLAYSLLEGTYQTGHFLDVFWILAFASIYCAAVFQQSRTSPSSTDSEAALRFNARMKRADTLIFASVLIICGAIAYAEQDALARHPQYLGPFFVALGVFLGLREWANNRIQIRLNQEIRASEQELNRILDHLDDTYYRTDLKGIVQRVSKSVHRLTGYAPEELIGRPANEFYANPSTARKMKAALDANDGVIHNYQSQVKHKSGERVWVSTNAHYIRDETGRVTAVEGTSRDVTELKRAMDEMRKLSRALEQSADGVMITDRYGIIEYVNPAFEATTGFSFDEALRRTPNFLKSGNHQPDYYRKMWSTIRSGEVFRDVMINAKKDGSLYYEDKTITPLMDESGIVTHFVSTGKDISEQIQAQERLKYFAHHDILTGLPNRILFLDRIEQALARTGWHQRLAAVLFMDLDQFKNINDSLGHEIGDKLLIGVARRLAAHLRPGDVLARFGGDEFVVLLDDIDSYGDIALVVDKLRQSLQSPIQIDDTSLHVTTTIGISVYPHDGSDGSALLKNADNAMYRAKEEGRNTYTFYSKEMSMRVNRRLSMENKLRRAVENEEFELHYQPQIDIDYSTVWGVEALLRWRSLEDETIGPSDFIPLLEDTGLIIPLGEWVLRTACAQVRAWNRTSTRRLALAVNISASQFTDSRFVDMVRRTVDENGLDPSLLQLEMTESIYLRSSGPQSSNVYALEAAGVTLAIDDFGTGYSALSYLKRLPIHVLKIDRSFIRDIPETSNDAALTVAVLSMAKALGLRVIAEGVEQGGQLAFLRENGCRFVQGFLFSQPLPASDMEALLNDDAFPASRIPHRQ